MKISFKIKSSAIILFLFLIISKMVLSQQENPVGWTLKSANKWIKTNEWRNGLSIKVHPSVNKIEFAKQYHANKALWDKAFLFIHDKNLKDIAPGKYIIDGDNVFATITKAPSKEFEQTAWESHRKYIDLQYVITGKEKMGVVPLADATVTRPYDESKDAANYGAQGKFVIATPKEFLLFFPGDVHRPGIKVKGIDTVKKLVIKIRYAN